jgi:hypothetical protein
VPKKAPHLPQFCHTAPLLDTSNCISCRNTVENFGDCAQSATRRSIDKTATISAGLSQVHSTRFEVVLRDAIEFWNQNGITSWSTAMASMFIQAAIQSDRSRLVSLRSAKVCSRHVARPNNVGLPTGVLSTMATMVYFALLITGLLPRWFRICALCSGILRTAGN